MAEKQSADADTSRGYYPRAGDFLYFHLILFNHKCLIYQRFEN